MATILIIFPQNKLTKLANFVQFIRLLMFCLEDLGGWAFLLPWLRHCFAWCKTKIKIILAKFFHLGKMSSSYFAIISCIVRVLSVFHSITATFLTQYRMRRCQYAKVF